jgi:hypothetical protein
MKTSTCTRARRVIVGLFAIGLLLAAWRPIFQTALQAGDAEPPGTVDDLIFQLQAPEGKVAFFGCINPGGPVFMFSAPMKKLAERGSAIQYRLLPHLKDPRIRNEIALILGEVGDKKAVPNLIDALPTKGQLTDDEQFSTLCILDSMWRLTGMQLGISSKFQPKYTPEFRARWQAWYLANKPFFYTPTKSELDAGCTFRYRVAVDFEAKYAATPTAVYRKVHPWITHGSYGRKLWMNA